MASRGVEINDTYLLDDSNLQGYWRLESDGTDSSGNGYTLAGTAPTYTTGKFGNGGDFDSANNEYLLIAAANCGNIKITGDQTWSCWYKPEDIGSDYRLMGIANSGVSDGWMNFIHDGASNKPIFQYRGSGAIASIVSDTVMSAGTWYHICGTYTGSNDLLEIYVNGVRNFDTAATAQITPVGDFAIGRMGGYVADETNGIIDDVAIWNRVLTDAEVQFLYYGGIKKISGVVNQS